MALDTLVNVYSRISFGNIVFYNDTIGTLTYRRDIFTISMVHFVNGNYDRGMSIFRGLINLELITYSHPLFYLWRRLIMPLTDTYKVL